MKTEIEFSARVKAFTGLPAKEHRLLIKPDGTVKVWDEIAGHYTGVHAMSEKTMKRIARIAVSQ